MRSLCAVRIFRMEPLCPLCIFFFSLSDSEKAMLESLRRLLDEKGRKSFRSRTASSRTRGPASCRLDGSALPYSKGDAPK